MQNQTDPAAKPQSGLLSSASATTATKPATASPSSLGATSGQQNTSQPPKAPGYKPTTSVSDNTQQLLNSDSAYMQQARQQGTQAAASRGLINSSIAAGASQQAAIQAAAPMAQADAQAELQKWNKEKTVQANLQGAYVDSLNKTMSNAMINVSEIETSGGINQAEKDKMIKATIARRDADMAFLKQVYSAMPTWSNNWSSFPTMPSAPGVTLPEPDTNKDEKGDS